MDNQDLKPHNLKTAISRMEAAERLLAQCMQKIHDLTMWIPCSERMPVNKQEVIVYHMTIGVTTAVAYWHGNIHFWNGERGQAWLLGDITHWMPLLDPPEER